MTYCIAVDLRWNTIRLTAAVGINYYKQLHKARGKSIFSNQLKVAATLKSCRTNISAQCDTLKVNTVDSVCLFLWALSWRSHSSMFHSYGDVTITGEGQQILTYARHSRPLSSEGSLACHAYCDTGHPFIMVFCWGSVTTTPIAKRLEVELSLPVFTN